MASFLIIKSELFQKGKNCVSNGFTCRLRCCFSGDAGTGDKLQGETAAHILIKSARSGSDFKQYTVLFQMAQKTGFEYRGRNRINNQIKVRMHKWPGTDVIKWETCIFSGLLAIGIFIKDRNFR